MIRSLPTLCTESKKVAKDISSTFLFYYKLNRPLRVDDNFNRSEILRYFGGVYAERSRSTQHSNCD